MKKVITLAALAMVSVGAQAASFVVAGGDWSSQQSWNTNATGAPTTTQYDNGEVAPPALLNGAPGIVNWAPALPASYDGTYSGTIITDGSGLVTGGSLTVTGTIGYQVIVGPNSWWAHSYTNLVLDFNTMTASASGYTCHDSFLAPATCAAGGSSPTSVQFGLTGGNEGIAGAARSAATFDGTTLALFAEGYSAPGPGTDYGNNFTISVVPVPAAVWLFGSALGLLGWGRRKA